MSRVDDFPRFYIGPMSKNVVDAVIEFSQKSSIPVGLIPSRRQVEHTCGYVNDWSTQAFVDYVKAQSARAVLQRDHGGPGQGDKEDSGLDSFLMDARIGFDLIHIDPWKVHGGLKEALKETKYFMRQIWNSNPHCEFEVGTEQAIREYSVDELDEFLDRLQEDPLFRKVRYAVVQSGTSISGTENTGNYDSSKLVQMIEVCKRHGLMSKEHNGDYLNEEDIRNRFSLGLDAINIAPEFGNIETRAYLEQGSDILLEQLFQLCLDNGRWKKWFPSNFIPHQNKRLVVEAGGHYVFSIPEFQRLKENFPDADRVVKERLINRLKELHGYV